MMKEFLFHVNINNNKTMHEATEYASKLHTALHRLGERFEEGCKQATIHLLRVKQHKHEYRHLNEMNPLICVCGSRKRVRE